MISEAKIKELVEEKIAGSDKFIVDVKISPNNKIIILVDGDKGINISDCTQISRHVESNLNRDEEDFELEVSSPGADRPLKLPRQFMKNTGRMLDYIMKDGKTGMATILSADNRGLVLEEKKIQLIPGKKKKEQVIQELSLEYEQLKEAKIHLKF